LYVFEEEEQPRPSYKRLEDSEVENRRIEGLEES
jgi:hypothetical protein